MNLRFQLTKYNLVLFEGFKNGFFLPTFAILFHFFKTPQAKLFLFSSESIMEQKTQDYTVPVPWN